MSPTLEDVRAAARNPGNRIHRTPVIACQSFDDTCGHHVFFKCEDLQRTGAFKIPGALNKLLALTAAERTRAVVAFPSGNYAPGVTLAARMVGRSSSRRCPPSLGVLLTLVGGGGLMAGCSTVTRAGARARRRTTKRDAQTREDRASGDETME